MHANGASRPSGLWLRVRGDQATGRVGLHTRAVPEHPSVTRLMIGAPGEPAPAVADVATFVRSMEAAARASLRVLVYGPEPADDVSLAQRLADALGEPVQARHGLVLGDEQETAITTAVDADGLPTWQPFACVSTYRPGEVGAEVTKWRAPAPDLVAAGPHTYALSDDWVLDVVPSGLVVRSASAVTDPWTTRAPAHPGRMDLFVDLRNQSRLPDGMLSALGRFADALPARARRRLRVVLPDDCSARVAQALRWAVPAPQLQGFPTPAPVPTPAPSLTPAPAPALVPAPEAVRVAPVVAAPVAPAPAVPVPAMVEAPVVVAPVVPSPPVRQSPTVVAPVVPPPAVVQAPVAAPVAAPVVPPPPVREVTALAPPPVTPEAPVETAPPAQPDAVPPPVPPRAPTAAPVEAPVAEAPVVQAPPVDSRPVLAPPLASLLVVDSSGRLMLR